MIPDRMKGNRFDFAISEMLPDYSRSKISNWIKSGHVLINNNSFTDLPYQFPLKNNIY